MKLAGEYVFEASVAEVWAALFDPVVLAAALPGCDKLERVGEQYVGELKVKIGPIQGKFTGKVDLLDLDEPRSYRMVIDGRGAAGFVNANAKVKLEADGERTRMGYEADAQIGGKLAGIGQRLVEASSKAIVAQSLEGLHANIKLRAEAYRAANPVAVAVAVAEPEPVVEPEPVPESGTVTESVARPVVFTPVKIKQADLASGVAKEVASSIFSRTVLAVIIAIQFGVIVWLLVR